MSVLRSRAFFALAAGGSLTLESLKANPLVPGVSVITKGPAKGHFKFDENDQPVPVYIDQTTLDQVMACAKTYQGGLRVNAGHFTGVLDAAAYLTDYRIDDPRLRGDMHLFPTYKEFEHLCSLITTISDTFGLSIDFSGPAEFREGKAFARCTEIYSADLVPVPAANDRGLFGAGDDSARWVFCDCGKITPAFDTSKQGMTLEELEQALSTAVANFAAATTNFNAASAKIDGLTTKLGNVETQLGDLSQKFSASDCSTLSAQLGELKTGLEAQKTENEDLRTRLATRLGVEFAARAGAKPPGSGKKEGEGDDTRKSFEIPSSEHNATAVRELLGK